MLDFLGEAQIDRAGCFEYSPVNGATANDLPDHIPDDVKSDRWHRFMQMQQRISRDRLLAKVGTTIETIVDEVSEDGVFGRTTGDAPEIDGIVQINGEANGQAELAESALRSGSVHDTGARLAPGDVVKVRITDASDYDLEGDLC